MSEVLVDKLKNKMSEANNYSENTVNKELENQEHLSENGSQQLNKSENQDQGGFQDEPLSINSEEAAAPVIEQAQSQQNEKQENEQTN